MTSPKTFLQHHMWGMKKIRMKISGWFEICNFFVEYIILFSLLKKLEKRKISRSGDAPMSINCVHLWLMPVQGSIVFIGVSDETLWIITEKCRYFGTFVITIINKTNDFSLIKTLAEQKREHQQTKPSNCAMSIS